MELIGFILSIIVFVSASGDVPKLKCERDKNAQACYHYGKKTFGKIKEFSIYTDQEQIKDRAAEYIKLSCSYGYQKACIDYANYTDYIKNNRYR